MYTLSQEDLAQAERAWQRGADRALSPNDVVQELSYWLRERALMLAGNEPLAVSGVAYAELRIEELTALAEREARARGTGGYQPSTYNDDLLPRFTAAKFADLVDLTETLTGQPARRVGDRHIIACPFHEDRTPSLTLYSAPRGWFCYSCRQGGDAVAFVAKLRHLTAVEALVMVETLCCLDVA